MPGSTACSSTGRPTPIPTRCVVRPGCCAIIASRGAKTAVSTTLTSSKHLLNPDFEEGTAHWELRPAEPGSISTGKKLGYNALQGRWPGYQPYGRAFLVMKRSLTKPNAFSQEITHLQPGRLYSLKMITADHQDLERGTSRSASHAISIALEGVEPQTGPQEAFSCPFHSGAKEAGFTEAKPLWMNYHWRVFRAKSATARLTVRIGRAPRKPAARPDRS